MSWFIDFSAYFYHLAIRFTKIYHFSIYIHIYIYVCVCVFVCLFGSVCVCVFFNINLNIHLSLCVHIYIYIYICCWHEILQQHILCLLRVTCAWISEIRWPRFSQMLNSLHCFHPASFWQNFQFSDNCLLFSIWKFFHYSHSFVVANVLDCDTVVSEFELHSCYDIHFRSNTLKKDMKPWFPQLWIKNSNGSSKRMALALENPQSLICH